MLLQDVFFSFRQFLALQLLEKVLCNNCHDRGAQTYPLISSQQAQLLLAVIALWSEVQTSLSSDRPHLPPTIREKLLIRLLPLSSHLLSLMETKDLLAVSFRLCENKTLKFSTCTCIHIMPIGWEKLS